MKTSDGSYSRQGFTLIEVMVALTIFTIGILAVVAMQGIGLKTMRYAFGETHRSVSVASHIEALLCKPYDDVQLTDKDHGYGPESPDHGPFAVKDGRATIEWEVADDFPVTDTKRIAITIRPMRSTDTMAATTYEYVKARDY